MGPSRNECFTFEDPAGRVGLQLSAPASSNVGVPLIVTLLIDGKRVWYLYRDMLSLSALHPSSSRHSSCLLLLRSLEVPSSSNDEFLEIVCGKQAETYGLIP